MKHLERRLRKLEERGIDPSGLVPGSQKWLEYWDRQIYVYMKDPEPRERVRFPLEAFRAVMHYTSDPASLVGSISGIDE
jgi:hypothetical protein